MRYSEIWQRDDPPTLTPVRHLRQVWRGPPNRFSISSLWTGRVLVADPVADATNVSFQVAEGGIRPFECRNLAGPPVAMAFLGMMPRTDNLGDALGGPFIMNSERDILGRVTGSILSHLTNNGHIAIIEQQLGEPIPE